MKKILLVLVITATVLTTLLIADNNNNNPEGWFSAGSDPQGYETGIDRSVFQSGQSSAYIKSKTPKKDGFATIMQTINADDYTGKRLKLSGFIKTDNVKEAAAMWMRVDGSNKELGFDNMVDRPIQGTTDWTKYEIILDVPAGSVSINYGALLGGDGQVWLDNFTIEEVDKTVAVTNLLKESKLPMKPVNLDFEE